MHENHHPHPRQPYDPHGQPSWTPPPPPYYPGTEPPRGSGGRALVGALIALVAVLLIGLAAAAVFLLASGRGGPEAAPGSDVAQSTVVQTVTEVVEPPSGERNPGPAAPQPQPQPQPVTAARPAYPQLPGDATAVSAEAVRGEPAGSFHNVYTGSSVTSSAFAEQVGRAYRDNHRSTGALNATVTASSPVTGSTYSMRCIDNGSYVTCTGGDNAVVFLS